MTYAREILKFSRTIKQLQWMEKEGITCRDCVYYPCSENKETLPLCVGFKSKGR